MKDVADVKFNILHVIMKITQIASQSAILMDECSRTWPSLVKDHQKSCRKHCNLDNMMCTQTHTLTHTQRVWALISVNWLTASGHKAGHWLAFLGVSSRPYSNIKKSQDGAVLQQADVICGLCGLLSHIHKSFNIWLEADQHTQTDSFYFVMSRVSVLDYTEIIL